MLEYAIAIRNIIVHCPAEIANVSDEQSTIGHNIVTGRGADENAIVVSYDKR